MPFVDANGIRLHYEAVGSGPPVVFCHEYASDARAWEAQLRFFGSRYRAIAYNGRGYPPSTVPQDDSDWLHHHLINDLAGLLDALDIERAHIVGQATGGNVALNFAIAHPDRVNGLVVIGAGAGTSDRERWLAGARALADDIAARAPPRRWFQSNRRHSVQSFKPRIRAAGRTFWRCSMICRPSQPRN
jgi:pimeloyl-ACP methyl ester carboxylesterase